MGRGRVQEIESRKENTRYLTFRIKRLLTDWLVNHILNADKYFGLFIRAKNSSHITPEPLPRP